MIPTARRRRRWPVLAAVLLVAALAAAAFVVLRDDGDGGGEDSPVAASGFETRDAGAGPTRAELAPDGTAYVASRGDDVVLQVAPTGDAVEIPVGDEPGVPAVASDGAYVYVPVIDGLWVIDTRTREATPLDLGGKPGPLRLNDDDSRLYVPVDDGTIRIIDTESLLDNVEPLDVGPAPERVHLSPDGGTGLSPDRKAGTVTVIDTAEGKVAKTLPIPGANGIQVTAAGTRAYVTADDGTVHVIDLASTEVVDVIDLSGTTQGRIRIEPDDSHAWVPQTDGTSVDVIDLETGDVESPVELGGTPGGTVVFDSTGETAYVPDYDSGDVAVIDTTTYDVTRLTVGDSPRQLTLSDDDSVLYAVGYRDGDEDQGIITAVALTS